jgi:hypothetical protein
MGKGTIALGDKLFIKEQYVEDPTRANIQFLSEKYEVSTRSIIAILTSAGLYKKQGYTNKLGERPVSKTELIDLIGEQLGVNSLELEGLDKANKSTLRLILRRLDPNITFKPL